MPYPPDAVRGRAGYLLTAVLNEAAAPGRSTANCCARRDRGWHLAGLIDRFHWIHAIRVGNFSTWQWPNR